MWDDEVKIIEAFTKMNYTGECLVVEDIDEKTTVSYDAADKNELPDKIIFGN